MFKKTITFTDFNGHTQTKDFYFHLSKPQLLRMAAEEGENSATARFQRIIESKDRRQILQIMEEFVSMACGMRSEDGSQFLQTEEAKNNLLQSPAYEEFLVELCTSATAAVEFFQELMPNKLLEELQKRVEIERSTEVQLPANADSWPAWRKESRIPTPTELIGASTEDIAAAMEMVQKTPYNP